MKKRSKLLILVSVMLVCCLVVGLAACSGGKKIVATDATKIITDAMYKSFNELNVKDKFGFDYSVTIPTEDNNYAVDVKGIFDAKTANNNKALIAIREKGADNSGNKEIFSLSADDEFLYLTTGDVKRRFTGLGLGAMIGGGGLPGGDAVVETMDSFIPLVIGMLFGGEPDKNGVGQATVKNVKAGKEYTVTGGLGELKVLIGGVLESLGIPGADAIGDFIGGIKTKMVAVVDKNGYLVSCDVVVSTDMGDITLKFTDAKIGNNVTPEFTTPSKTDKEYIQHAPLNFTLLGDFGLYDEVGEDIGKVGYEIRADIDVFGMLRGAMANGGFDATKLFSQDNSKLFINLEHLHEDADTCKYCATKVSSVDGSILTIAYDPASFETRDVYISANIKNILGKNTLGAISPDIATRADMLYGLLGEYIGTHVNPEALITFAMSADKSEPEITVLDTPSVTFVKNEGSKTGKAKWNKVNNASDYVVTVNGESTEILATAALEVAVNDGDVVTVQANGNPRRFSSSVSAPVKFEYYDKLKTPTLEFKDELNEDGSIKSRVIAIKGSNTNGLNYVYTVNGGEEKSQPKSVKTIAIEGFKPGDVVRVKLTPEISETTPNANPDKIRRESDWAEIEWEIVEEVPSLPPTGIIGGIDVAKAVLDGVYFISRLWVDGYEAKFNVDALVDFVANFDNAAGMEVSGIIETIMADASWFGIKVSDKSMYGDVANTKMDTYKKFDLVKQSEIDNPEAAKKSYIDVAGNNWTPSLNNTYTTGKDGKVVITNGTLSTHDADGNPIALTEDEAKELLATGYVTYTYTDIHGNVIEKIEGEEGLPGKPGNVIKTLNIDWDKTGVAQNVTVIITISDGQGLSGLLALVNALLPMFIPGFAPVEIPGAMVETSITLANVA